MNDVKIKQQIIDKIKSSTNILVTVSDSPSVDALSAALGLSLMLNQMDKHATAIFSGDVPPAINFLDPNKTFESTTDSLRDFIIALDKEKADHLRYKVEGDVVKIFITPYRTTISSDDLVFSQGDFNVELVIALGVDNPDHLDKALEAHGKILHDATVLSISAGDQKSDIGGIEWRDAQASGLCEMLAELADSFKTDKDKSILDQQMATALLTGIVAVTERFSNNLTSSKVMTIAAQLMAAGADQQLIAAKLQESHEISSVDSTSGTDDAYAPPKSDEYSSSMSIDHAQTGGTLDELEKSVNAHHKTLDAEEGTDTVEAPEAENTATPDQSSAEAAIKGAYAINHEDNAIKSEPEIDRVEVPSVDKSSSEEPSFGGTLNATSEQAQEDAHREDMDNKNKTILSHAYLGDSPTYDNPINGAVQGDAEEVSSDIFSGNAPTPSPSPLPDVGSQQVASDAIDNMTPQDALSQLDNNVNQSPSVVLPQPPPLPDFSAMPPPPPSPVTDSAYAPDPALTPTPEILSDAYAPEPTQSPPQPSDSTPDQFKIPGQQ